MKPILSLVKRRPDVFKRNSVEKLNAQLFIFCNQLVKMAETYRSEDLSDKKRTLKLLGLTNSENYREILRKERLDNEVDVINFYKKKFPNSLLMRRGDFEALIKEYRLVCGSVDMYVGSVPDKNLEEIKKALFTLSSIDIDNSYMPNKGVGIITEIFYEDIKLFEKYQEFPFVHEGEEEENINYYNDEERFMGPIIRRKIQSIHWRPLSKHEMLIAATTDQMKVFKYEHVVRPSVIENDPIVFQYLPMGIVIIHSKWGAEEKAIENYKKHRL